MTPIRHSAVIGKSALPFPGKTIVTSGKMRRI